VPSSLSIKPHTRVNWENKDSVSHHLILTDPKIQDGPPVAKENSPNLPNNDEVPSGGGFAHVFEKPGIYGFHDADNPTANVIVIVHK
jgi:plastocyanin